MAKWYVVFEGLKPGIYTSWHECSEYVLNVEHARYQSYKTHAQAVQEYNDALRMGTVRQVQARSRTNPVLMAPSHATEGKNVIINKPSSGNNVIIVILGVLVLVLWSRLSTYCSCN
jgi:ribonuclease HI